MFLRDVQLAVSSQSQNGGPTAVMRFSVGKAVFSQYSASTSQGPEKSALQPPLQA